MILKNKTKYLLMAGMPGILTTPLYAQQIYMCKPCPANTYSNGKECVPCGEFQYSDIGSAQCTDLKYEIEYKIAEFTIGGQQTEGTLTPGFYAIILGGGNGGPLNYFNGSDSYYYLTSGIRAGYGAKLQYIIRIDENTPYTLASGADGVGSNTASAATGGGGGSWAKIGDTYYVAGGGGGAVTGVNSSSNYKGVSSQGGYGGGTGAGGGGGDDDKGTRGTYGGNSGKYGGGFGNHDDGRGGTGGGVNNGGGLGGAQDSYGDCAGGRFTYSNTNPYGGRGGLFSVNRKCWDDQTSATVYYSSSGYDSSCRCTRSKKYTTTGWVRNGGDGKTSHTSNTDKFTSLLCKNCAKIFKIK